MHPEYVGRSESTLRVPLAARKVNDESQDASPAIRSDQLPAPAQ